MEYQQRTFLPLETIEEEADQTLRSHVREDEVEDEDEDEDLLMPVEVEAKPAEAEREEDQVGLQVLRQRRKKSSGQMSRNSSPSLQVRLGPYEDGRARAHGSHDESGKKRSRTYRKSTGRTVKNQTTLKHAPFPKWLVDLMVNIEEARTHQLVVE